SWAPRASPSGVVPSPPARDRAGWWVISAGVGSSRPVSTTFTAQGRGAPSHCAKSRGVAGPYEYRYRRTSSPDAAAPSAGSNPGSQADGDVYVTRRPRNGPKHSTPRRAATAIACRQPGHQPPNAGITGSDAHGPVAATTAASSSSTVRSRSRNASPIAAITSSDWEGVSADESDSDVGGVGIADSAPVHSGSSAAGS